MFNKEDFVKTEVAYDKLVEERIQARALNNLKFIEETQEKYELLRDKYIQGVHTKSADKLRVKDLSVYIEEARKVRGL